MNNMNMAGMNAAGGPVGGMPMINNGSATALRNSSAPQDNSIELLNSYIYDYFLRMEMWEPARAMIKSGVNVKANKANGVDDTDSKDNLDGKLPDDLPASGLPSNGIQNSFLHDWWSLFWDIFGAQRGKSKSNDSLAYVQNSQNQQRMLRENQLRQIPPNLQYQAMMRMQGNNRSFGQNEPLRKALQNSRNATPAQLQHLKAQEIMQQNMRREGSDVDINGQQRPQSPSSADNAPSPKRQRLEGGQFNGEPMRNGMGQPQVANQQAQNAQTAQAIQNATRSQHMLMENGINPSSLSRSQFNSFQQQNPQVQAKSIQVYNQNLANHHGIKANGIPGQGSPMMPAGPDGQPIPMGEFYPGPPGSMPRMGAGGSNSGNHALQDYQMQLMLLEQQNKKRLLAARAEQAGGVEMRQDQQPGQANFTGMSPQGSRNGPSPNPSDQMKRGTPKLNQAGIPGSPLGDPMPQSRDSPNGGMTFGPNGVTQEMMQFMPNGMRPPSSHPPGFSQGMTAQQVEAIQQAQRANQQNWQRGPGGQPMMQNPSQDSQQMTPQQRNAMPPPQVVPAGNGAGNGRAQPSPPDSAAAPPTPQPANKAAPKSKKERTAKKPTKKGSAANLNAGATPSSEAEPPTPTPATPITPMHRESFNGQKAQNGANGSSANGQTATSTAPPAAAPQPDTTPVGFPMDGMDTNTDSLVFADPNNDQGNVFENFDFNPFLEEDGMSNILDFDTTSFAFEGGVETGAGEI